MQRRSVGRSPALVFALAIMAGWVGMSTTLRAQIASSQKSAGDTVKASAASGAPAGGSEVEQRVATLEARLKQLEQRRVADSTAAARSTTVLAGKDGFSLRAADGSFQLKLRGYFQTDGRFFGGDRVRPSTSGLLLRRMRPLLEATLYKSMDFRIMPDFGGGTVSLFDAHFDLRLDPAVAVRVGKYKPPIGLERLQSATDLLFTERGLPTNLVPSRDLGVQLYGDLRGGVVSYAAGVFNGVPDLGNGDADNRDEKDVAVRLFTQPFRSRGPKALSGLGLGVAAGQGVQKGTIAAPFLPGYRSPGQQTVFAYRSDATAAGTVLADGGHTRVSPQGYFYLGRFGLLGELVRSSQDVRRATTTERLDHDAWQLASSFVLTGEKPTYRGVTPTKPFDRSAHSWGAFEIGARVGALMLDKDAFPLYANPQTQVRSARSAGIALNWYLARGVRLHVDYEQTRFEGGATTGNRENERALLTRVQHSF